VNETERYLFDLYGYLVVKRFLSQAEVAALNAVIDGRGVPDLLAQTDYVHTGFPEFDGNSDPSAGPVDIYHDLLLNWGEELRNLVDHPRLLPYLQALLGDTFRLDHSYGIFMRAGAGRNTPHHLHNGGTPFDPSQYYVVRDATMFNGLVVASFALSDAAASDGGFCVIPGSHKANFRIPPDIAKITDATPPVVHVPVDAGDLVLFTEAVTHGAIPWTGRHDRRAVLYKYCPGFIQWESQSPWADLSKPFSVRQRRLLAPPHAGTRPLVTDHADASGLTA
jgi:ectoine hydroxylase-related dioxygenase (phytanoyl-CoA dioxygenase family)